MFDKDDYTKILDRARRKRNNRDYLRYLIIAAIAAAVIGLIILIGALIKNSGSKRDEPGQEAVQSLAESESSTEEETTIDEESLR